LIDVEANAAIFDHEGDHAAVAKELLPLAHRQDTAAQEAGSFFVR
jgi:hypothetical protein